MIADERDESRGNMVKFAHLVQHAFRNMSYMPLAFITAKTGKNVKALLNLAQSLFKQANRRVGTGTLNRVLREAVAAHPPASREGRAPRIYYATQVGAAPPTIVLFVNSTRLFDATYQRYLLNVFRDKLPFRDVPIKLYLRSRTQTSLEERKAGRGRAEGDSGEGWIDSDDDFEGGRAGPGSGDDVEDVRYINLEVNELLSDLDS
jgi:GTP-binding protein